MPGVGSNISITFGGQPDPVTIICDVQIINFNEIYSLNVLVFDNLKLRMKNIPGENRRLIFMLSYIEIELFNDCVKCEIELIENPSNISFILDALIINLIMITFSYFNLK